MVWQNTSNEAILIIKMDMEPGEGETSNSKLRSTLFPYMFNPLISELKLLRMNTSKNA